MTPFRLKWNWDMGYERAEGTEDFMLGFAFLVLKNDRAIKTILFKLLFLSTLY